MPQRELPQRQLDVQARAGSFPYGFAISLWRQASLLQELSETMSTRMDTQARRQQVIDAATQLFWRKGYDAVSIGDIVKATGLNRYALYQAFGGKKDLFMAVLDSYTEDSQAAIRHSLEDLTREPIDALREVIVAKMLDPAMFPAGCLMCTTSVDVAAKDEDVARYMANCSASISQIFIEAYKGAQSRGLAPADGSPEAFAELANALYFSTGMQARMGRSRVDLQKALDTVCDSLRWKRDA